MTPARRRPGVARGPARVRAGGRGTGGAAGTRLIVEPHAPESLRQIVRDHLDFYNVAVTGLGDYSPVSIFLRDRRDEIVGGLLGFVWGGWLYVQFLWVAGHLRGRGHGARLLRTAERIARDRRCRAVYLTSFSFQAPGFYRKQGYREFARLDDHPLGHAQHFLRKDLARNRRPSPFPGSRRASGAGPAAGPRRRRRSGAAPPAPNMVRIRPGGPARPRAGSDPGGRTVGAFTRAVRGRGFSR